MVIYVGTGYCVLRLYINRVLPNFVFHLLGTESFYAHVKANERGASYPAITDKAVKAFPIPIPPLAIQHEIVKILDTFTTLEAELEAELEARKKQYEYYREALLTFGESVALITLGEVADYRRGSFPQPYGNREWYDGENAMPFVQVVDVGENMRLVENTKR